MVTIWHVEPVLCIRLMRISRTRESRHWATALTTCSRNSLRYIIIRHMGWSSQDCRNSISIFVQLITLAGFIVKDISQSHVVSTLDVKAHLPFPSSWRSVELQRRSVSRAHHNSINSAPLTVLAARKLYDRPRSRRAGFWITKSPPSRFSSSADRLIVYALPTRAWLRGMCTVILLEVAGCVER